MANFVRQPSVADQLTLGAKYGPTTGPALQRSQYLADALKSLDESAQQGIRTKGALWANLLSEGLLTYGKEKADQSALDAYAKDQTDETNSALTGLEARAPQSPGIGVPPQAPPESFMPRQGQQPPPQMAPQAQAGPPPAQPGAPTPEVLELARMVYGEARGEKPEGQNAVAAVALNRARKSGKPLADVLAAPHQFEGYNAQARSQSPQALAQILANIAPAVGGQDPTGGAQNFLNPELQAQMGRAQPKWAPGNGQRIGNHVFYGGQPGAQAQAAPPIDPAAAMGNAGGDPFPPSPVPQAAAEQAPAPGGALQPSGAGAGPQQQQWPTWKPSQQEVDYVKRMLNNPRTHAEGLKVAQSMQQKMTQPVEATVQIINGVPTYIPKDPTAGIGPQTMAVPQAAMSQTLTAQQAGVQAPPGTTFNRDPNGNMKQVYQPQNGQQVTSAPGQPYAEAPIQGGTNDPRAPAARFNNEGKLRDDYAKEVAPYVAAREGYQKVVQAAGDMSPAGSIAMVFGYMKTLDPGSTVREGEQASVANSGNIPQSLMNIYNKLLTTKGTLTPEQREQFANSAKGQFDVYQRTFDAANKRYGDLAQNYGMDPRNVTRQFDPIAEFKAPQSARAPISEAAKSAYQQRVQRGLIDPKAPMGSQANPYQARDMATFKALDVPANRGKYVMSPDGQFGIID